MQLIILNLYWTNKVVVTRENIGINLKCTYEFVQNSTPVDKVKLKLIKDE